VIDFVIATPTRFSSANRFVCYCSNSLLHCILYSSKQAAVFDLVTPRLTGLFLEDEVYKKWLRHVMTASAFY
jgi:hypothetical protein